MTSRSPYRQPGIERERIPDGVQTLEQDDGTLVVVVQPYTPRVAALWAVVWAIVMGAVMMVGMLIGNHGSWAYLTIWPGFMFVTTLLKLKRRHRVTLRADGKLVAPSATYAPQAMELDRGNGRLPRLYLPVIVLRDGTRRSVGPGMQRAQAEYVVDTLNARLHAVR